MGHLRHRYFSTRSLYSYRADHILSQEQITEGPTLSGSFLRAANSVVPQILSHNDRWHVCLSWSIFFCLWLTFWKESVSCAPSLKELSLGRDWSWRQETCPRFLQIYKIYIFTNNCFICFPMCDNKGIQVSDPQRSFEGPENLEQHTSSHKLCTKGRINKKLGYKFWTQNHHERTRPNYFGPSSMAISRISPHLGRQSIFQNPRASSP